MGEVDGLMQNIRSSALAVSAGRLAVTASTLGLAGTMPALVFVMEPHLKLLREATRRGLLGAGLVGMLCKQRRRGQGHGCGHAGLRHRTDMAATELAATMALEHHLGMSCDSVGRFVLIPCLKRIAFGALKEFNAALMAKSAVMGQHWEDLDRVVAAMPETGQTLPPQFREMAPQGSGQPWWLLLKPQAEGRSV